jgi:hypothetical protein
MLNGYRGHRIARQLGSTQQRLSERHEGWCGARLRLILTEHLDPGSVKACPACLEAFRRGYPEALMPTE